MFRKKFRKIQVEIETEKSNHAVDRKIQDEKELLDG